MSEPILLSVIGGLSATIAGVITWLFGRRKESSEIKSSEIQDLKQSLEFLKDSNEKNTELLNQYMTLVDTERIRVYKLSTIILKILDNSCTKTLCLQRVFYTETEVSDILGLIKEIKQSDSKEDTAFD